MSYIVDVKGKLDKYVKLLNEQLLKEDGSNRKFLITYTYIMKNYYEILYHYKVYEKTKELDNESVNNVIVEINKAAKLINVPYEEIHNIKTGSYELYKAHKLKISKWSEKTPRNKIIKELEKWTGKKGEMAVVSVIAALQDDTQFILGRIMNIYNQGHVNSATIIAQYYNSVITLLSYYVNHKIKYLGTVDNRTIRLVNNGVDIFVNDQHLLLDVRLRDYNFSDFGKTLNTILNALDSVDKEIINKYLLDDNFKPDSDDKYIMLRKQLKQRIRINIEDTMEFIEMFSINVTFDVNTGHSVQNLIKMAKSYIKLEKEFEANVRELNEIMEIQYVNGFNLLNSIIDLTGNDVKPCVVKLAACIKHKITDKHIKEKKITKEGEEFIKTFI